MPRFLGLDFGTESVRAVVVGASGSLHATAVATFADRQITASSDAAARLFRSPLAPHDALQHPADWIDAAVTAVRDAITRTDGKPIAGIGVDFTSCTMLPARADGSPLCLDLASPHAQSPIARHPLSNLGPRPHAWPKLWKHHGAHDQAQRITTLARQHREPWLDRYGGSVGLEWLFPKMLEVIEGDAVTAAAAEVWLEAGDWFVWQLIGSPWMTGGGGVPASDLPRSTCQAGYKALWSRDTGYPSREFLTNVHEGLADTAVNKLPGRHVAPGVRAGSLCEVMARRMGLDSGIPISAAIIDAHAGVPGAGVASAGDMVLVMGTSGCHMLLAVRDAKINGVAGIVRDGILPGYYGIETGQAAMGDAFDFVRRLTGHADFATLERAAADIPPGADGVVCIDWFNGCRTPLMDGSLRGAFLGLTLHHTPAHLYRAALEASACGLRWIVETLRDAGVPVERFIATGGLPSRSPLFMRIIASVLNAPISIPSIEHGPALGAAILGALACGKEHGGFDDAHEAVTAMAGSSTRRVVEPVREWMGMYEQVYGRYRAVAETQKLQGT